jgi:hypothetical protein
MSTATKTRPTRPTRSTDTSDALATNGKRVVDAAQAEVKAVAS